MGDDLGYKIVLINENNRKFYKCEIAEEENGEAILSFDSSIVGGIENPSHDFIIDEDGRIILNITSEDENDDTIISYELIKIDNENWSNDLEFICSDYYHEILESKSVENDEANTTI